MMTFDAALEHIRAAYPQGVPPEQHAALAELLARTVGPHRTERLLEALDVPAGDPAQDYLPVLAVLRPQLDDADMAAIADQLAQDAREQGVAPSEADARDAIQRATEDEPKPEEIARIRAMLAAHGWPFEGE